MFYIPVCLAHDRLGQRRRRYKQDCFVALLRAAGRYEAADLVARAVQSRPPLQREALILAGDGERSRRHRWLAGVDLPQRARTVHLFLCPRDGTSVCKKAGEIRGSTLTWRWGSDEFVLNTDKRIAPGGGALETLVRH
jgi:hypothetical protein